MRTALLGVIAASQLSGALSRGPAALPWLHGLSEARTTEGVPGAPGDPEAACPADAQAPLQIVADVAPAAGRETITATLTGGIHVTSIEGIELAATPGYPCEGTADALESLSVGRIFHEPVIVLALTSGGRREQMTWLGVYRVGPYGGIDALFAGAVEMRVDGVVRSGKVTFLPGALIYRPPGRRDSLWVFDPVVRTYTPRGPLEREGEPHS